MGLLCALGFTIDRRFGIQGRMSTATAVHLKQQHQFPGTSHSCLMVPEKDMAV